MVFAPVMPTTIKATAAKAISIPKSTFFILKRIIKYVLSFDELTSFPQN